jgi:upstream activation factor subunit UAF30
MFNAGCDESAEFSRPDIVKIVWEYIKEKDLQDPKNRRNILADDKLRLIFTFPLNMFTMNKQLSKHLKPSGSTISRELDPSEAPPKKKAKKKDTSENGEKKKSGFSKPLKLSDGLAELVGQPAMSRGRFLIP